MLPVSRRFSVALAPFDSPGVIQSGHTIGYILAEDQALAAKVGIGCGFFPAMVSFLLVMVGNDAWKIS